MENLNDDRSILHTITFAIDPLLHSVTLQLLLPYPLTGQNTVSSRQIRSVSFTYASMIHLKYNLKSVTSANPTF